MSNRSGARVLELLQGQAGLKGDGDAAEMLDARQELGIEGSAVARECEQLRGIIGVLRGEHAGSRGRGLLERGGGFGDDDPGTAMMEF